MRGDFQLVDYENERSRQLDELSNLAKLRQADVDPSVFAGFPEHTADVKQPALLWAALSLTEGLLRTALQCKVTAIHSLEVPPVLTNAPPTNSTERLTEIPLQVEFTGLGCQRSPACSSLAAARRRDSRGRLARGPGRQTARFSLTVSSFKSNRQTSQTKCMCGCARSGSCCGSEGNRCRRM